MAANMVLRSSLVEKVLKDTDSIPLTRGHTKELAKLQGELKAARILLDEYIGTVVQRLAYRPSVPVRRRKSKQPDLQDELDKELDDNPTMLAECKAQDEWTNRGK